MDRLTKVLSIDGGGIRGVIPALVLEEIERRTARPISTLFDLVAGTSTGGIIALGVTRPNSRGEPEYSAADIVDLYEGKGKRIFSNTFLHELSTAWGLLDEKYPADEVEKVFDEYFGDTRLKDALTNVFVTAFEIELRSPWFFRSSRARTDPEYDFPMKKVARATSAAPTYFEPLRLEKAGGDGYWALVDGGVYANNPTMCALVEAHSVFGTEEVLVVSLGTGAPTVGHAWKDAKDWGLVGMGAAAARRRVRGRQRHGRLPGTAALPRSRRPAPLLPLSGRPSAAQERGRQHRRRQRRDAQGPP